MVARKVMDINHEAQEYLKQFTPARSRRADQDDVARESMFDTLTREKYRGKGHVKKGAGHLPKEWSKMSSAYSGTNMVEEDLSMVDDLLNVHSLTIDQQDTYMNEEAFLEQLLQEDTKPHKSLKTKSVPVKPHGSTSSKTSTNGIHRHSHKTIPSVHSGTRSMDMSGLVQGQHSLNQSRRAVLRHVKADIHPTTLFDNRKIPPQDVTTDSQHSRTNSSSLKSSVHLMPVCQKCGWNRTQVELSASGQLDQPLAVDTTEPHYQDHIQVVERNACTTTNVYSTLRRETGNGIARTTSGGVPYSPRSNNPHGRHSHSSTDSAQEQTSGNHQLSPRQKSSLSTSRSSHHKASQTDPSLLGKDGNSSGESGRQQLNGGASEQTKAYTRAKPPSGRPPRAEAATGSVDSGDMTPAVEAIKAGNLQTLKSVLEADPDQARIHDVQGSNLLHVACERGHMTCVQHLAMMNPRLVEEENKAKFSPAALTIKSGHPEVLDWLIENTTAKEEMVSTANKKSLLHHAAKFGQDGCLRIVLEKLGALDRHNACCDSNGNSPAHVAAKHGHLLCLQTLLEYNMDVTKANRYGHSPCYYADFSNHRLCAGYLMVVETCLNLAKKLIRLERSMEQLSTSLAKYSDNNPGELAISVDYSADRSSATSSVEDDGTRDDAWQLLCRKFEEASKRLVVFRTQNRAMRPLRPTKLALLALAQTKEDAQSALSLLHQTKKPSSCTKSLDGDDRIAADVKWDDGRSRSFPDLPSSLDNEGKIKSEYLKYTNKANEINGTDTYPQENQSQDEKAFTNQHLESRISQDNTIQVIADIHSNFVESRQPAVLPFKSCHEQIMSKKSHRRSSSVGDIIESERPVHEGDISYHLKTRVLPPSPKPTNSVPSSPPPLPPRRRNPSQEDQLAVPKGLPSHMFSSEGPSRLTEKNVQANERQLSLHLPNYWTPNPQGHNTERYRTRSMDIGDNFESETDDNTRGAAAAFNYDRNAPHRRLYNRSKRHPRENRQFGENEQTSDFFEDSTGKHDSDTSELNPETLQKILDMQEEILRCHPSHLGGDPQGTRIRTPIKLELTTEDFKETYARQEQEAMDDEVSSPFRLRQAQSRSNYSDTMNKSGNNSHTNSLQDVVSIEPHQHQEENVEEYSRSNFEENKPWYEMTDDEEGQEANDAKKDQYFTVL